MSRIDELLAELCSDGVVFRPLADVGSWQGGGTPSKHNADYWRNGTIPWVTSKDMGAFDLPGTEDYITESAVRGSAAKIIPSNSVAIVMRSGVLKHSLPVSLVPFAATVNQDLRALTCHDEVMPRYALHVLRANAERILASCRKVGGTVESIDAKRLMAFRIPVPPLEVQREIVRVLDMFTALEAELEAALEAELEARRRQYAHYRYMLLAREGASGVEWTAFGDVASVRHGCEFPRSMQGRESGMHPFYKVSDMNRRGNEVELATAGNYIDSRDLESLGISLVPVGTVLIPRVGAAVATNKKRLTVRPSVFDTSFLGLIPGPETHPRFLLHWMTTVDLSTLSHRGGAVPSVRRALLEAIPFPRVSLEDQARIAAILDKFDALVNDLSSGIPAELAARRKQYEHYRDGLLTFKEAAA